GEHLADGLQRLQLAVGIELVVLGFVGRVGGAGFLDAVGITGGTVVHALAFGVRIAIEYAQQTRAIVSEILVEAQGRGQGDDGDHVRRGHLRLYVLLGSVHGALGFVRSHGAQVEKQDDYAPVAQSFFRVFSGEERLGSRRRLAVHGRLRWAGG